MGFPHLSLPHLTLRRCLACSTTPQSTSPSNFCDGALKSCWPCLSRLPTSRNTYYVSLPYCLVQAAPCHTRSRDHDPNLHPPTTFCRPPTTRHQPPTTNHPPPNTSTNRQTPPACQDSVDQTLGPLQIVPSSGNLTCVYLSLL